MSHPPPHENFNVPNTEIGVDQYPPQYPLQSAKSQASYGVSNFADGSGHIFSMYLEMATEEDKKMVENWKADADGILIFTGLFSAAVASLISVSIQGLQQNPQDTTNFYLANIYQTLAEPNGSNTLTSPPSPPTPFSPPNSAVWVNALWFLSLVISLTCALLATLLQQWARRYLKITQSRYTPHKRARIRAFFAEGVDKCLLPWTVDALPTLLHISLFLFFAGLVVFLCNVNLTIFKLVSSWVGLCTALYGCITCMPIICHHSPYYTPLSLPAWHILTWALFFIYGFLCWLTASLRFHYRALDNLCARALCRFQDLEESCHKSLVRGMQKTAEETALNLPSAIDTRAFMWTFDCLDEDHELEHFFAGLPSFRSSKVVKDPLPLLTEEERSKLYEGLHGLLNRTFLSDLLPAPVKNRRAIICTKAIDPEHTPNAFILHAISFKYQHSGPVATEIAKILRGHGNNMNQDNILRVRFAISKIIGTRQPFDDSWYNLASYELGFPETSLRDYAAHGDNFSFLILIYLVRQQFTHFGKSSWPEYDFSFVLATASTFNVKDSSPKLQHEFCTLWNEIVRTAQPRNDGRMASFILGRIRSVFLSLHQDTNSAPTQFSTSTGDEDDILWDPSSYPQCKVPDHHSYSTPQIHDNDASLIRTCAIRHGHDNTAFVPFIATPDPTSSFTHAPLSVSVDETHTDVLPPDNQISVPVSTQVTDRTSTEGHRIPTISLSPVSTCAVHGNIDPSRMTQPSTSSPSHKSNASASPSAGIAVGRTELSHTPSGDLNVLSSPSPSTPVLDAILPTESHSSRLALAPEGEGSTAAGLSMGEDTSYSPSAIREDITPTAGLPPRLLSPSPVVDEVMEGPSTRSLSTEHIEHRPLDPTHSPYDIV